jgi:16S rRNA processing protein RimM
MNGRDEESDEPLVAVARAVRTRGLKGEIVADLLTDFPERFDIVTTLVAVAPDNRREAVELEKHWFQKDRIVLKFKGYDDVETAKTLVGYEFAVPEAERVPLAEGSFYEWELQGCRVETVAGKTLGAVKEVLRTGGVEMLVIRDDDQHEFLVPMAETIVVEIDIAQRRILIDPPEGLLEL